MKDFLTFYSNPNEERMNFELMGKKADKDLYLYLIDSFKTLELLPYIKLLEWDYIEDEKSIDINNYITSRKKKSKKDMTNYQYMDDSRYAELRLKFLLECGEESVILNKSILVPLEIGQNQYLLKGKKYFMMYQLVDASTYTSNSTLTLKSSMAIDIKRDKHVITTTEGMEFNAPIYTTFIFKKEVDILLLYFAKMGVVTTLEFFRVDTLFKFVAETKKDSNNYYFRINKTLYLRVNKTFFDNHQYVQSIAAMILKLCTNRTSMENVYSKSFWLEKLGKTVSATNTSKNNFLEKGNNVLLYYNRRLDNTTRSILKVHGRQTEDIYTVVRWMIQNYNELRKKENMDLANKRLRCNEYIASLLTSFLNERANRINTLLRNQMSLKKVKEIFAFRGDVLISQMFKSGILRYDDTKNDMDFWNLLKFTLKGPNSLGNKNSNNISMRYRGIHTSFLGRIDLNVCGNSDPGTSGILSPFAKTDGLYFDGSAEPEEFEYDFVQDLQEYYESCDDKEVISLKADDKDAYYDYISKYTGMSVKRDDGDKIHIRVQLNDD